jgi:putative transposase
MQTFSLKPGLVVRNNDRMWVYRRRQIDNRLQFTDENGEVWIVTDAEFHRLYDKRDLVVDLEQPHLGVVPKITNAPRDLSTFAPNLVDEALRRQRYVNGLLDANGNLPSKIEIPGRIAEIAQAISDRKRPPSSATICRWVLAYRVTRCIIRLVPGHWRKGRKAVIEREIEDMLLDVINDVYLKPEAIPILKVWEEFKSRVDSHNRSAAPSQQLILPSRSSVYRYVDRLDPYLVDRALLGKRVADLNSRTAATEMQVRHILDRWEIDHTPLDVLIVDPETGNVIGRPYLTVVIDRASRMVMAFLIHLSAPNTESVLRVIDRAIRPKREWLSQHPKVINVWPARGLPLLLMPDNAAEFHAGNVYIAFNDLGIELMYPRTRAPQMKGAVERIFKTMNVDLIHCLPGTTRSNVKDKGDYPSEKFACLTLHELEALILKWIVDCYHQKPHRGLKNKTPAEVWKAGESERSIHLPADLDSLECILAMRDQKALQHYGVDFPGLRYNMPELGPLRQRLAPGEKVDVRYRDELGHIWVYDKFRKIFLKVPCTNRDAIGMSRDIYEQARKIAREAGKNADDFSVVHRAYQQIMADVESAKQSNKLRQRRNAAKTEIDKEGQPRPKVASDNHLSGIARTILPAFEFDAGDIAGFDVHPNN